MSHLAGAWTSSLTNGYYRKYQNNTNIKRAFVKRATWNIVKCYRSHSDKVASVFVYRDWTFEYDMRKALFWRVGGDFCGTSKSSFATSNRRSKIFSASSNRRGTRTENQGTKAKFVASLRQRLCDRHRVALREKRPPKQKNGTILSSMYIDVLAQIHKNLESSSPSRFSVVTFFDFRA